MTIETGQPPKETETNQRVKRRNRVLTVAVVVLALVAALAIGVVVGWLAFDGEGTESTVSAETEQEINALIDDWLTAWRTGDGQLALDLFAVDGRFVSLHPSRTDLEGWSGEEISAGIDRRGGPGSHGSVRVGSLTIIERPNSYLVASRFQLDTYGSEDFEMFNIVEEDGSLKIRFVGPFYTLGLFQLAEGMPPLPVADSE
jgi:hypothetical protein